MLKDCRSFEDLGFQEYPRPLSVSTLFLFISLLIQGHRKLFEKYFRFHRAYYLQSFIQFLSENMFDSSMVVGFRLFTFILPILPFRLFSSV